ncbi:hypothetical protein F66182_5456 [Fusarium sp. NRRL 66182]|nr:hypothetical protein F66182_5456 [Fusarium sp. NRRL 66182]
MSSPVARRDSDESSSSPSSSSSASRSRLGMLDNIGGNVSDLTSKWKHKILNRNDSPLDAPVDLDKEHKEQEPDDINDKDPSFGAHSVVQTLYEGKDSVPMRNDWDWQGFPPKQFSKSVSRARDRVAIKVYKIKDLDKGAISGRCPLKYYQVDVRNPLLVAALEPILKKENIHLDVHDIATFKEPFRPLWFCQDEIRDLYRETQQNDPLKGFMQLFLRVLDDIFRDLKVKQRNLVAKGLIDFRTAWTLFPRDSTAYSYGVNSDFIAKVDGTEYETNDGVDQLVLTAKAMDFNGEEFVWTKRPLTISEFNGNKPIRDLRHYPFDMHPDKRSIMDRLLARGRKVLDLQGLTYCSYNGIALYPREQGVEKHNVECRILIDVVGYNKHRLAQGKRENRDPDIEVVDVSRRRRRQELEELKPEGKKNPKSQQNRISEEDQQKNKEELLQKPQELAFMSELIGGYALKNKLWVYFYVEDLEPIIWNDQAYSHLVFDEQQKDLILSFVQSHSLTNGTSRAMTDVIAGKGQGLVMLLSGPPGTGKTLMAEAVADRAHRPLLYLQAEDLGINAASLGAKIKRVFEMATEWNAIILLDEADVFMAERNPNDIHRNELVSIFLRELEYYRGIMFLTTNLYRTIDTAFRSRVSLHLFFGILNREARETIWRKFLGRLPEHSSRITDVTQDSPTGSTTPMNANTDGDAQDEGATYYDKPLDDEDIAQLALWQLNGREIKTAVKMVRSWCDYKGYTMTLSRLENGIKVTSPQSNKDGDIDRDLYE